MFFRERILIVFPGGVFGGCFLKTEEIRTVSGLGIFKHDTVCIIGLVGDYGQAVVILQFQIFFIDLVVCSTVMVRLLVYVCMPSSFSI